jgi:hypothetical protein
MPVTAKLSKRFYEKFGDDVANELVDWFNAVDATYRADLRELNELNFARFDAKLEQRVAGLRADFETRLAALDAKLDQRLSGLRAGIDGRFAAIDTKFVELRLDQRFAEVRAEFRAVLAEEIGKLRAELIKWSFLFFATAALAVLGLR